MDKTTEELIATSCALCGTDVHDRELYKANFKPEDFSAAVFSARRLPDRVHYRIVTCKQCGLVRSNPVLGEEALTRLYEQSHFTYAQESIWASKTYAHYFKQYLGHLGQDARVLEVGCGNGTFLAELHSLGYKNIFGVEPSKESIAHAGVVQGFIYQGILKPEIYPAGHFDVIACFQVLDHIAAPNEFLATCSSYLKPGGSLLLIMHDIGAWTAKLLGRSCPMVDIEHPFLYNKNTLKKMVNKHGLKTDGAFTVKNRYPLKYWSKLAPMPKPMKEGLTHFMDKSSLGQIPVSLGLGNMGIVATKI